VKISIDLEMSPEEMRRLIGLPDVQAFNQQIMDKLQERMTAGVEGYDPMSLFQPYLRSTQTGVDLLHRMMGMAMSGGKQSGGQKPEDT
jgi:hypothetical protein